MQKTFTPYKKIIFTALAGLSWVGLAAPAWAQTTYTTPANLKAEARKNKKEAAAYAADYKESHLNVANFTYKRGVAGRRAVAVEEEPTDYTSDKEINALYASPKKEKKLLKEKKRRR